ncbi:MAG: hypothetical protein D6692_07625 [Planctomycetota bacterium]|nr:MAG: hypothetical protein D6692_07625 [Planctomycetota bacterium]
MPTTHERPRVSRPLIALNAALLLAFGAVTLDPHATAQNTQTIQRPRGEYTLLGGAVTGSNANAIYVIDAANNEMVAMLWDDSRRQLTGFGYRDLNNDLLIAPER